MDSPKYIELSQEQDDRVNDCIRPPTRKNSRAVTFQAVLATLLAASAALNTALLHRQYFNPYELADSLPSRYANLPRNITSTFALRSDHESANRTLQDEAWNSPDLEWWTQYVVVDHAEAARLRLPQTHPWPWNPHKGQYILNGAHDLHCLQAVRNAINEYEDDVPEEQRRKPYEHVIHCLNALRQSVMCNADDTPLYVGPYNANANSTEPKPGVGSARICRDWDALNAWARAHSGCFRPIRLKHSSIPYPEQFKFCPDGSKPWLVTQHN